MVRVIVRGLLLWRGFRLYTYTSHQAGNKNIVIGNTQTLQTVCIYTYSNITIKGEVDSKKTAMGTAW